MAECPWVLSALPTAQKESSAQATSTSCVNSPSSLAAQAERVRFKHELSTVLPLEPKSKPRPYFSPNPTPDLPYT